MRNIYLLGFLLSAQLLVAQQVPEVLQQTKWYTDTVAQGLYIGQHQWDDLFDSKQSITVLSWDGTTSDFDLQLVYADSNRLTSNMASDAEAIAAINGSFFDIKNGGGVKYLKVDGQVINYSQIGQYKFLDAGAFAIDQSGQAIILDAPTDLDWTIFNTEASYPNIMVSGPWILKDQQPVDIEPVAFNTNRHPRSFVCTTLEQKVLFVTVDGRNQRAAGMRIQELQVLAEALGCVDALNLDGGGSTTIWIKGMGVANYPSDNGTFDHAGERPCANIIALIPVKEE